MPRLTSAAAREGPVHPGPLFRTVAGLLAASTKT